MSREMKVFLSSTYEDLKEHRRHVIKAVRDAGLNIDPMEHWPADPREPTEFSQDRVIGCDLLVILVGLRRGFIPSGETKSVTQLEYDTAIGKGIDVLAFVLDEDAPWQRKFDELEKDPELKSWRTLIRNQHGAPLFGREPNSIDISSALFRWRDERERKRRVKERVASYFGRLWLYMTALPTTSENEVSTFGEAHMKLFRRINARLESMRRDSTIDEDFIEILDQFLDGKKSVLDLEKWWSQASSYSKIPYDKIRSRLNRGDIVFFLGADTAFMLSCSPKAHGDLIAMLAEKARYDSFEGSLSKISEYYELKPECGRQSLLSDLGEIYSEIKQESKVPQFYERLADVGRPLILISTAQDNLLEEAFTDKKFVSVSPFANAQSLQQIGCLRVFYSDKPEVSCTREELSSLDPLGDNYSVIYRLCGPLLTRDSREQLDALPISENDYITAARFLDRILPDYLVEALRRRVICFLGYSPQHWEDRLLVRELLAGRGGKEPPDVAVTESRDQFELAFWQRYEVVRYQVALNEFAYSLFDLD